MGGVTRTIGHANDPDGNRTLTSWPDSQYVSYYADGLDRLDWVYEGSSAILDHFGYYDHGTRWYVSTISGINSVDYYYATTRLAAIAHAFPGTPAANVTFAFPGYNPAGQITNAVRDNDAYVYAGYSSASTAYAANGLNQYAAVGGTAIGYDLNGNLTSNGGTTFNYDAENRLISTTGTIATTMVYDPLGRLFQTTGASGIRQFLYDGDELAAEYDGGTGAMVARYVHGTGEDDPLLWYNGATMDIGTRRFLHADQQGSIIGVSDAAGNSIAINSYDEYGVPGPSNVGRFQYTGQAYLPDLGMYYYKARIYSARLGRFLQTDPIGYKDQVNLYAYVGNDPIDGRDPSGLRQATNGERAMASNLGLALGGYLIMPTPKWVMGLGGAIATTFPWEMDISSDYARDDFSVGSSQDKALFYHEIFHIFQDRNGIKPFLSQAKGQISKSVNYNWNPKLPWSQQNFEAQAEAFGDCAGAGAGCGRLEGQSISGNGSTLSFKKGTFTLSTEITGSKIPKVTTFKAPTEKNESK